MSGFGIKNDEFDSFWEDYNKRLDDELAKTCPQPTVLTPDQQETLKDLLDHYKDQLKGVRSEKEDEHDPATLLYQTGNDDLGSRLDNAASEISDFLRALPESQKEKGFVRKEDGSFELVDKTYKTVGVFTQEFYKARDEVRAGIKPETLQEIKTSEAHNRLMSEIDMKALGVAAYKSLDFLVEQRHSQNKLQPEPTMKQTQESSGYDFHIEHPYQVTKERAAPPPPPWMGDWNERYKESNRMEDERRASLTEVQRIASDRNPFEGLKLKSIPTESGEPPWSKTELKKRGYDFESGTFPESNLYEKLTEPSSTKAEIEEKNRKGNPEPTREEKIADRLKQYQDKKTANQEKKLTAGKGIKKKP